jgi:uncharacterized membrane protein YeaQ/YmgE (transglycosylase-associated protein family)
LPTALLACSLWQVIKIRDKLAEFREPVAIQRIVGKSIPGTPPAIDPYTPRPPYIGLTLTSKEIYMGILWTIIIGFVAGVIAKFIMPGHNEPTGFILTAILGIVGAFVATFLGQALGWYRPGEGAGLIGAVVGAVIVLLVYSMVAGRRRAI